MKRRRGVRPRSYENSVAKSWPTSSAPIRCKNADYAFRTHNAIAELKALETDSFGESFRQRLGDLMADWHCGRRPEHGRRGDQPAQFLDQAEFVDHIGRENIVPHVQEALNRALQVFEDFSGVGEEVARDMAKARM
jgi:hypothetical protein